MNPTEFLNILVVNILNIGLSEKKIENHGGVKNTLWQCAYRNTKIGYKVVNILISIIESEIKFDNSKRKEIFYFLEQFLTVGEKEYMEKNTNDIKSLVRFASVKINSNKSGLIIKRQENSNTDVYPLKVVVGLVIFNDKILLVKRRDSELNLVWQFPAGILKKNKLPEIILEREVKAETNVICKVISSIGKRVHPDTQVVCEYYLCEYLSGELFNADSEENEDVQWVNIDNYERYITSDIYIKVKNVLEKLKKEVSSK